MQYKWHECKKWLTCPDGGCVVVGVDGTNGDATDVGLDDGEGGTLNVCGGGWVGCMVCYMEEGDQWLGGVGAAHVQRLVWQFEQHTDVVLTLHILQHQYYVCVCVRLFV